MAYLLKNVSVDTDGDPIDGDGSAYILKIWATDFGGGSVNIETLADDGITWILESYGGNPASFTTKTALYVHKIAHAEKIRATLTDSSGASNVNATIST